MKCGRFALCMCRDSCSGFYELIVRSLTHVPQIDAAKWILCFALWDSIWR